MCNHYRTQPELFDWTEEVVPDLLVADRTVSYQEHIYPRLAAPIVFQHAQRRILVSMRWGIPVSIKTPSGKQVVKPVTNSRDDKLSGFTWRFAVAERRCIIPAVGYYEPGQGPVGAKGEILFTVREQPRFFFAGLWDGKPEEDPDNLSFSMVTTTPNEFVKQFHDRMPVVLTTSDALAWLGESPLPKDDLTRLCRGLPAEALQHETLPARLKITRPAPPEPPAQGTLL